VWTAPEASPRWLVKVLASQGDLPAPGFGRSDGTALDVALGVAPGEAATDTPALAEPTGRDEAGTGAPDADEPPPPNRLQPDRVRVRPAAAQAASTVRVVELDTRNPFVTDDHAHSA
jgi:hypothetical protein